MRRLAIAERPDWRAKAEKDGFVFHSEDGVRYWDESVCYAFTLREIEDDLEAPTADLEDMCMAFVDRAARDEEVLKRLAIPELAWPLIADSWGRGDRNLYGRFDFAYDGTGPAKLLEYNADTPTTVFETGYFQWIWLEDQIKAGKLPKGADQFNSLHDRLVGALKELNRGARYRLHLACVDDSAEDRGTIAYIAECARQAGVTAHCMAISDISLTDRGLFVDERGAAIEVLFKLYPWEWMLREEYGARIANCQTRFIEPIWKTLLSNKGLLPYLWRMAPNHPNLLEAYFADEPAARALAGRHVKKPLLSREGANVTIENGGQSARTDGPYGEEGFVVQRLAELFRSGQNRAVLGSWVVAGQPAGLCIREDDTPIIGNRSRFVPHFIEP